MEEDEIEQEYEPEPQYDTLKEKQLDDDINRDNERASIIKKLSMQKNPKSILISVRVPYEQSLKMQEIIEQEGISMASFVNVGISNIIEAYNGK